MLESDQSDISDISDDESEENEKELEEICREIITIVERYTNCKLYNVPMGNSVLGMLWNLKQQLPTTLDRMRYECIHELKENIEELQKENENRKTKINEQSKKIRKLRNDQRDYYKPGIKSMQTEIESLKNKLDARLQEMKDMELRHSQEKFLIRKKLNEQISNQNERIKRQNKQVIKQNEIITKQDEKINEQNMKITEQDERISAQISEQNEKIDKLSKQMHQMQGGFKQMGKERKPSFEGSYRLRHRQEKPIKNNYISKEIKDIYPEKKCARIDLCLPSFHGFNAKPKT